MRILAILSVALTLAAACGGGSTPTSPSGMPSLAGTWVGTLGFDSSGSMMGAGVSGTMMSNATMTLTQTGSTFSGAARFPGYMGGDATISGTMSGTAGTFTMTMPTGSMMTGAQCTATATGTFDMDDMRTQLRGNYSGMNSCSGAFNGGQMTMTRR